MYIIIETFLSKRKPPVPWELYVPPHRRYQDNEITDDIENSPKKFEYIPSHRRYHNKQTTDDFENSLKNIEHHNNDTVDNFENTPNFESVRSFTTPKAIATTQKVVDYNANAPADHFQTPSRKIIEVESSTPLKDSSVIENDFRTPLRKPRILQFFIPNNNISSGDNAMESVTTTPRKVEVLERTSTPISGISSSEETANNNSIPNADFANSFRMRPNSIVEPSASVENLSVIEPNIISSNNVSDDEIKRRIVELAEIHLNVGFRTLVNEVYVEKYGESLPTAWMKAVKFYVTLDLNLESTNSSLSNKVVNFDFISFSFTYIIYSI